MLESRIIRCRALVLQPSSSSRLASQSSSSGWLGGSARRPKSLGVRTRPDPKWCIQTRLTQTRLVKGLAGSTIALASSRRPLPCANGLGLAPAITLRKWRDTSSPWFAGFPLRKILGSRISSRSIRATACGGAIGDWINQRSTSPWSFHIWTMVSVSKNHSTLTIGSSGTSQGENRPWRTWRRASESASGRASGEAPGPDAFRSSRHCQSMASAKVLAYLSVDFPD